MTNLFEDITKEVVGAFSLGILIIVMIIVLSNVGSATGQELIANQAIQAILILVGGIGIPLGIISLIKWLGGFSNENGYGL